VSANFTVRRREDKYVIVEGLLSAVEAAALPDYLLTIRSHFAVMFCRGELMPRSMLSMLSCENYKPGHDDERSMVGWSEAELFCKKFGLNIDEVPLAQHTMSW
jgi:hypothetical protein